MMQKNIIYSLLTILLLALIMPSLYAANVILHYNDDDKGDVEVLLFLDGYDEEAQKEVKNKLIRENDRVDFNKYSNVTLKVTIQKLRWANKKHNTQYELRLHSISKDLKGFKRTTNLNGNQTMIVPTGNQSTPIIEVQYEFDETKLGIPREAIGMEFIVYNKSPKKGEDRESTNGKDYKFDIVEISGAKKQQREAKELFETLKKQPINEQLPIAKLKSIQAMAKHYIEDYKEVDIGLTQTVNKKLNQVNEIIAQKEAGSSEKTVFENFKVATNEDKVQQAEAYVNNYPDGAYYEEILFFLVENTKERTARLQYIDEYLSKYPDGKRKADVLGRKKSLEEVTILEPTAKTEDTTPPAPQTSKDAKAFEKAKKASTIAAYQAYFKAHNNGKNHKEADKLWWALITKAPTEDKYRAYLNTLPKGLHAKQAKLALCQTAALQPIINRSQADTTVYKIHFKNNCNEERPELQYNEAETDAIVSQNWSADNVLDIKLKDKINIVFKTTEKQSESILLDPGSRMFKAAITFVAKIAKINNIQGGSPPFTVELYSEALDYAPFSKKFTTSFLAINTDSLLRTNAIIKPGKYKLRLWDSQKAEIGAEKDIVLDEIETGIAGWMWALGTFLLLLVVGGILQWQVKKKEAVKKQRKQDLEADKERKRGLAKLEEEAINEAKREQRAEKMRQKRNLTSIIDVVLPEMNEVEAATRETLIEDAKDLSDIKITRKDLAGVVYPPINKAQLKNYYLIELNDLWNDTIVANVYMHKRFALRLHNFIFDENEKKQSANEEIPEIGGFLLGHRVQNPDTKEYDLYLELFIDIEPENNGVYQIEFGEKAWTKLDNNLDTYRDIGYTMLGWFHTHPGHGLFLSGPDTSIHQTHFTKPYHIALELDSVQRENNPNYYFSIFSRNMDGKSLNNSEKRTGQWFEWNTVKQWLDTV